MTSFVKKLQAVTFALLVSFTSLPTAAQTRQAPYHPPTPLGYGVERVQRPSFDLSLWQRLTVPPSVYSWRRDDDLNVFSGRGASSRVYTQRDFGFSVLDGCDITARPMRRDSSSVPRSGKRR
jgi:hypothetical protein